MRKLEIGTTVRLKRGLEGVLFTPDEIGCIVGYDDVNGTVVVWHDGSKTFCLPETLEYAVRFKWESYNGL